MTASPFFLIKHQMTLPYRDYTLKLRLHSTFTSSLFSGWAKRIFLTSESSSFWNSTLFWRYSRVLSLPCPIFSPLNEYQAPAFSIRLHLMAASSNDPIFEIPVPNIRSISHFLKGGATLFFTIFTLTLLPVSSSWFLPMDSMRLTSIL